MKMLKSKTMAILVAAILTFSMSASMMLIPNASAHSPPWNIPTYSYVEANPNPAGVGQTINIGFWINQPTPTAQAQFGDRWQNFKLTITAPDGTTQTLGPFTADDTGGTHTDFTPSQIGNYTILFSFPGQTLAGNNLAPGSAQGVPFIGDYYEPSNATTTLAVQQTPLPIIPENPLPTNYWTRPINSVNELWSVLGGAWLGLAPSTFANTGQYNASGDYNPYTLAPTTAHILWTQPAAPGGQIGGEFGGNTMTHFYAPAQYEPKFAPIILDGVLYYEMYPGSSSNPTGWAAVNLKTGATLWEKNTTGNPNGGTLGGVGGPILKCGQTLDYVSPNQYGAFAYLWATGNPFGVPTLSGYMLTVPAAEQNASNPGSYAPATTTLTGTTYSMYDAVSGDYILSIVNCSSTMTLTEDAQGDLIGYYVSTANPFAPTLNMWNSTRAILLSQPAEYYGATSADAWFWRPPQNGIIPFSLGIQWTAPLATNVSGVPLPSSGILINGNIVPMALSISGSCIEDNVILMTAVSQSLGTGSFQPGWQIEAGYDATTGAQLWITNRTETPFTRFYTIPATAGVYAEVNYNTHVITGYSMTTGNVAWGPISLTDFNPYTSLGGYQSVSANGINYLWGFGGEIYAINMATGAIVWQTDTTALSGDAGSNTPYGVWPLWTFSVGSVASGMLFVPEGHQYSPPMFRGSNFLAINATNGKLVWDILGFNINSPPAVSDGVLTTLNSYDNQIYAYGMGPSKTTVEAPNPVTSVGSPIVIQGTVTDVSAGSQQEAVAANFPNGLPCVSDTSMTTFMEAVYMQQPMPTNTTGVPVTVTVTDSNDNTYDIGTATSNSHGFYSLTWTPTVPGNFSVTATFAGTQSYYGSSATTAFYAGSSSTTSPTSAPATGNYATTTDFMIGVAVLAVIIVIIGAVLALLMLRKRP